MILRLQESDRTSIPFVKRGVVCISCVGMLFLPAGCSRLPRIPEHVMSTTDGCQYTNRVTLTQRQGHSALKASLIPCWKACGTIYQRTLIRQITAIKGPRDMGKLLLCMVVDLETRGIHGLYAVWGLLQIGAPSAVKWCFHPMHHWEHSMICNVL